MGRGALPVRGGATGLGRGPEPTPGRAPVRLGREPEPVPELEADPASRAEERVSEGASSPVFPVEMRGCEPEPDEVPAEAGAYSTSLSDSVSLKNWATAAG